MNFLKPCKAPLSFGKWRYKNVLILLLLLLLSFTGNKIENPWYGNCMHLHWK